jgi:hypothetical protein
MKPVICSSGSNTKSNLLNDFWSTYNEEPLEQHRLSTAKYSFLFARPSPRVYALAASNCCPPARRHKSPIFFLEQTNFRPAFSIFSLKLEFLGYNLLIDTWIYRIRVSMGFMTKRKLKILMRVIFLGGMTCITVACSGYSPNQESQSTHTPFSIHAEVISTHTPATVSFPTSSPMPLRFTTLTPLDSPTPDTRLLPYYWRDWSVSPDLSATALQILLGARNNPSLDVHFFSKVGDCQMTPATFLGGFANGSYAVPVGQEAAVTWFSNSMTSESVTAANGLGISSVLDPLFGLAAGHSQCQANETPLDCELRTRHPAVVLVAMGTNWKPHAEVSFEKYLRQVVDRILAAGALPILATKADDIEGDWKLDLAIAQVAYDYDLPLVNVWRSVQSLPNHGLEAPLDEYLTGDGWMAANYAWLDTLEKVRQVFTK